MAAVIDEHIPNGRRAQENLRGVPMKHYDLLREGIFVFVVVAIVAIVLAAVYGSPDYPTITAQSVAEKQPIAFLKTTTGILLGNDLSAVADYGPPYTKDSSAAQHLGPVAPANWLGVTRPIDPAQDFVLGPLGRVAKINWLYAAPLKEFKAASPAQQRTWVANYDKALGTATVSGGQVQVPPGDYGPVAPLMTAMLSLGQSGMLEGALAAEQSGSYYPYSFDFTRQLLYFANASPYMDTATHLVQQGNPQWGIVHETGRYPGAWWLAPYQFLYEIPQIADQDSADLIVVAIMTAFFALLLLLPLIPWLNRLPHLLKVYRLIWWDWYRDHAGNVPRRGA